MSPHCWINGYVFVFTVIGSGNPGRLYYSGVHVTSGVVRLSNFSLKIIFHNLDYGRKSLRETNIIRNFF